MSKLKVAVIGCGSISKYRHLPEYHHFMVVRSIQIMRNF